MVPVTVPSLQLSHLPWGTELSVCCSLSLEGGLRAEASPPLGHHFDFEATIWGRRCFLLSGTGVLQPGRNWLQGTRWWKGGLDRKAVLVDELAAGLLERNGQSMPASPPASRISVQARMEESPGGGGEPRYALSSPPHLDRCVSLQRGCGWAPGQGPCWENILNT